MRGREMVIEHSGVQALGVGCWVLGDQRGSPERPTPNAQRPRRHRRGFTLVEVLVVMIILAILAAVVVPRVVGRTEDARRSRATSDIAALDTALDLYKADNGKYPATEQGLQALRESPGDVKNWNGPYLKKAVGSDPW